MREKDVTAKEYLEKEERIADIMNAAYHGGCQVVLLEHVHIRKCRSVIKKQKNNKRESNEITRDIASLVYVQTKAVHISIEVQTEVHYAMPLRVWGGDYADYQEQWRKIKETHRSKKDLRNAQYLSGFAKEDRLIPGTTIVLYMGIEPWDGPRCLKDMLDMEEFSESMKYHIVDYPLCIIDVRRYPECEKFTTDLKFVFGFLQRDQSGEELQGYLEEHKDVFSHLPEDAFDLLAQYSGSWKKLETYKNNLYMKEGEVDMCKAIDDLIAKGEKRGYDSGYDNGYGSGYDSGYGKGNVQGILFMVKRMGFEKTEALGSLMDGMNITKEKAEEYVNLYW